MSHHHPGPAPAHGHGAAPGHGSHDHGAAHGPGDHDHDEEALTELLDLDGEVLRDYLDQATAWIAASAQPPVTHIIDLGAGTGTGTFALLRRFPDAHVTAVDLDPRRLDRLRDRARDLGLSHRVTTVATDLDQPWPNLGPADSDRPRSGLGPADPDQPQPGLATAEPDQPWPGPGLADLVWASMALHHVADPARTLTQIFGLLRPGGSLAVAETTALESFPRFLPDGESVAGAAPGLEDRVHQLLAGLLSDEVPELGADWGSRLAAAGFELTAQQTFAVALDAPLPPQAARYAQLTLDRLRTGVADRLTPADQQALATLLAAEGPASVLHRPDLTVRATRLAWLARRP
jgi:SAM-dependent methyltransferase